MAAITICSDFGAQGDNNVVLASVVQGSESALCAHISAPSGPSSHTLLLPPLQVTTEHGTEVLVLYSSFPLAVYFTHGSVYMSISGMCLQ